MKQLPICRTRSSLFVLACLCQPAQSLSQQTVSSPVQGGGTQGLAVNPHSSSSSVAASTPVEISGRNLMFLADEATTGAGSGTDMNADADTADSIAVVVDMSATVETNLAVAAVAGKWIGNELYLVVDEALDGKNWEPGDSGNTLVLLHWSAAAPVLTFVDRVAVAGATKMVAQGVMLFYSSGGIPILAGGSNMQVIHASSPLSPLSVSTQDVGGPLSPRILGKDEGLIFLALDESAEGRDLNNDADVIDTAVLALLDGTSLTGVIRNTELALPGISTPFRARRTSAVSHDWRVGFLVSETAQGGTNFNDPALFAASWAPSQCFGQADVDAADDVLHFLHFAAWDGNPVLNPPVNAGLVGAKKIVVVDNVAGTYIGVISPESSEGSCDLNSDGDKTDDVFRWVQMATPVLPLNSAANLHALAGVPGGTHGAAELDNRFVILVSESADNLDINGDGLKTLELLGWLSPSGAATPFDFTHGSGSFVGATWMAEQPDRGRLDVAFPENVGGVNINAHLPPIAGEDTDVLDSVPTFANFVGASTLGFPGVAIAVDKDNAGIVIARDLGFYRVSEVEDSRDWNADGDELDTGLQRASLTLGVTQWVGDLNTIPARLSVEANLEETAPEHAAFLADETMRSIDFNGDGDALDLVVMWLVLGEDCNNNDTPDDVDIASATSSDFNANQVPDECDTTGTFYCFGDGSGAACPCDPGQSGGPGEGCRNFAGIGGTLAATGVASVASDTVTLLAAGLLPNTFGLYFQGTSDESGGQGSLSGDGLMCVAGTFVRLGVRQQTNGSSAFGYGVGSDPLVSVKGQIPAIGGTRTYQVYYRDPYAYCTSSRFNLTNGLRIQWAP